jgi:hypothetical protein
VGQFDGALIYGFATSVGPDGGYQPVAVDPARGTLHAPSMPDRSRKRPADLNSLAASIVEDAIHEDKPRATKDTRDPAAVALGRRGGLKGGRARAVALTSTQRSEIARRAAHARWGKDKPDG